MNKNYKTASRKRTPWDGVNEPSPLQVFIRKEYVKHYNQHHDCLDSEAALLNSFKPEKCPHCGSDKFKLNGTTSNKTQKYKCKDCNRNFTIITGTIFDNHKIPISEWIEFILNLFSNSSINLIAKNNKNANSTSKFWIKKLFLILEDYQSSIVLNDVVYIDEMYYRVIESNITYNEKQNMSLSKNNYCIGVGCDKDNVICFVEGKSKTSSQKTISTFKNHIKEGSVLIHDCEHSHNALVAELNLKSVSHKATGKAKIKDKDNPLKEINHHCANIRYFLDAHPGFNRDELQDYLNLYSFKNNVKGEPLIKVEKLLELALKSTKTITFRQYFAKKDDNKGV